MFNEEDIHILLKKFPKFELCYEKITHKKVFDSNVVLAIPEGTKYVAWFTTYNKDNVCVLLEINDNKQIYNVKKITTGFIDKLALGTIFYGTLFKYKTNNCFCVEDMYYYAGKYCNNMGYFSKLELLNNIFKSELSQMPLNDNYTIFGLPLINNSIHLLLNSIHSLPYTVNHIKYRFFDNKYAKKIVTMPYFNKKIEHTTKKQAIFRITADIEPDIYNLFVYNNGIEDYYDIAFIPDYKTSVMMNKLFRNIKENYNLDAIEESDDEQEFEDNRQDKYVYLDRTFNMLCEYNFKFKRWIPISVVEDNTLSKLT
jgi:hypothetical protein